MQTSIYYFIYLLSNLFGNIIIVFNPFVLSLNKTFQPKHDFVNNSYKVQNVLQNMNDLIALLLLFNELYLCENMYKIDTVNC